MKTRLISLLTLALLVLAVGLAAALFNHGTAEAALVNTGVPAWCYFDNVHGLDDLYLACFTPPGSPSFTDSLQRVPLGYYFFVTDVIITPKSTVTGSAIDLKLEDAYGTGASLYAINYFRAMDNVTTAQHYFSPMWTLVAGHRLEVVSVNGGQPVFDIRVNGFLSTNATYMPFVASP